MSESMTLELQGTFPALVTPFNEDSSAVDFDSLKSLLEFQKRAGVNGFVACGSTGEASTLSDEEYLAVCAFVVKHSGGLPCIAGINSNNTMRAAQLAREAEQQGVQALLISNPPYNKPTQQGLVAHFREIKRACALPLVAYNIPGRSGVNLLPATVAALARERLIIGVKEASGSMDQMLDLLRLVSRDISVLSGEDSLVAPLMSCGGKGVISASANLIPAQLGELTKAALAGDFERAGKLQLEILPVIRTMFIETNPIPVKEALAMRRVIRFPSVRLPLTPAQPETKAAIAALEIA